MLIDMQNCLGIEGQVHSLALFVSIFVFLEILNKLLITSEPMLVLSHSTHMAPKSRVM